MVPTSKTDSEPQLSPSHSFKGAFNARQKDSKGPFINIVIYIYIFILCIIYFFSLYMFLNITNTCFLMSYGFSRPSRSRFTRLRCRGAKMLMVAMLVELRADHRIGF